MSPKFFKLHILNEMGAQIDFNSDAANNVLLVELEPYKINTSGALVYGTKLDRDLGSAANLADGGSLVISTAVDNSSNLDFGFHGWVSLESDCASAGTISIYMEKSVDGGTTYPSDSADFVVEEDADLLCVLEHPGGSAGTPDFKSTGFEIL